jgi:hypothetical protein
LGDKRYSLRARYSLKRRRNIKEKPEVTSDESKSGKPDFATDLGV